MNMLGLTSNERSPQRAPFREMQYVHCWCTGLHYPHIQIMTGCSQIAKNTCAVPAEKGVENGFGEAEDQSVCEG
jgi:hypothetical protein